MIKENELDRRYNRPAGGALKTNFWDRLMVVMFVPPFLIWEQWSDFIGEHDSCQELLTAWVNQYSLRFNELRAV
jgi:hypothetical protein